MLPVVAAASSSRAQVVVYSWAMVAASLLLVPVAPMGLVYLVAAPWSRARCSSPRRTGCCAARQAGGAQCSRPMRLFHFSITYLTLLFVAVAIDPLLYLPVWR